MKRTDEFTPDVCEAIFHAALQQGDAKGVESALMLLAPQDPHRAQELFEALEVALAIWRRRGGPWTGETS